MNSNYFVAQREYAFSENQHLILSTANQMFKGATPLNDFEQEVLNYTFNRLVKTTPTLSGRK